MARRAKAKRVRRRKVFNVMSALESIIYANIITMGVFKTNVVTFFTGSLNTNSGLYSSIVYGDGIGLRELLADPGQLGTAAQNFKDNGLEMAIQSFATGVGFKLARRLLRAPLRSINSNLIYPALGRGVKV
tara:strand:+ start:120 stop:512 length:393 start_codon:yes stop_codon:yes gene_type:complete